MYISLDMDQYDENNIMISEKTKNNIMTQGDFYRLYFSTPDLILNGLHINFELKKANFCFPANRFLPTRKFRLATLPGSNDCM